MLTKHLILSFEKSFYGTHQRATLTGQVAGGFTLKGGFEEIAGTNTYTQSQGTLFCFSRGILIYGV